MARRPVAEPPLEPTEEELAIAVSQSAGVRVDPSNTGDDRDIGDQGAAVAPPGSDDMLGRLTIALEALASNQNKGGRDNDSGSEMNTQIAAAMVMLAKAMERMTEGQMDGSRLIADATKRAQRPNNEFPPSISAFNLRGDKDFPKPPLKCQMFLPWPCEPDSPELTREEIELLNILEPGEYIVKRNDNTKIKMTVRIETKLDSDDPSRLIVNHDTAFNNDYHRLMPPMDQWLRGMLNSKPRLRARVAAVLTMDEEAALILAGKLNDGSVPEKGKFVVSRGE